MIPRIIFNDSLLIFHYCLSIEFSVHINSDFYPASFCHLIRSPYQFAIFEPFFLESDMQPSFLVLYLEADPSIFAGGRNVPGRI